MKYQISIVLLKKTNYATEITKIKNDYVTTTALDARHKDLVQKQHLMLKQIKLMIKLVKTVQKFYHMKTNLNKKRYNRYFRKYASMYEYF